jgi:putative heme transporter
MSPITDIPRTDVPPAERAPASETADHGDPAAPRRRRAAWIHNPLVLTAIVVIVLAVLVSRLHSTEHDLVTAYRHLSWARFPWLLLALGAEAVSFLCYALVQRSLLLAGGARLTRRTMVALAVAATGLTNLVPGGTAPASGWLVKQYRRREIPMPLALWAVLAGGFAATVSILLLLLVGAGVAGLLGPWEFAGCAVVLVASAVGVVAGVHHLPALLRWLERHQARRELRLLRRVAHKTAGVARFRTTIPGGVFVLGFSVANWAMDVFVLIGAFGLLGLPVPWRAVLFAYAAAQVAGSLAPVPGGVGFVEGGMIGAFALAGSGLSSAILATIIYRAITCWLVAAVGSLMLAVLSRRSAGSPASLDGDAAELTKPGTPGARSAVAPVGH